MRKMDHDHHRGGQQQQDQRQGVGHPAVIGEGKTIEGPRWRLL
jgi:hypothetical protein